MKPYHGKIVTDPALIAELNAGSYEVQPGAHESIHAFNANCKKTGDAMGHVECIPRPTTLKAPSMAFNGVAGYPEAAPGQPRAAAPITFDEFMPGNQEFNNSAEVKASNSTLKAPVGKVTPYSEEEEYKGIVIPNAPQEEAATKPTFLQEYGVQTFLSGAALLLVIVIWWTFTRQPALRNNILIGAATLAAFCFNPIAGAIVLAAWIFSRRDGQIKS